MRKIFLVLLLIGFFVFTKPLQALAWDVKNGCLFGWTTNFDGNSYNLCTQDNRRISCDGGGETCEHATSPVTIPDSNQIGDDRIWTVSNGICNATTGSCPISARWILDMPDEQNTRIVARHVRLDNSFLSIDGSVGGGENFTGTTRVWANFRDPNPTNITAHNNINVACGTKVRVNVLHCDYYGTCWDPISGAREAKIGYPGVCPHPYDFVNCIDESWVEYTNNTACPNNAACVSNTIPDTMYSGQTVNNVNVVMRNTSTVNPWTSTLPNTFQLVRDAVPYNFWGAGSDVINLTSPPVALNTTNTFTFNMTAPVAAGTYPAFWRMIQQNVGWFGASCGKNVVVSNPNCTISLTPTNVSIPVGSLGTLTPTVTSTATVNKIVWSSSNPAVGTIPAETSPGVSNHVTGISMGNTTITATANLSPSGSCSTTATVNVVTPSWWQVSGGDVYAQNISSVIPLDVATTCRGFINANL